ncbi:hypothetical protein [Mangrovibacterium lignilyticum]|uniref:hypothetical protein n=1 Tax=Mangrovibacterium lignilyticum TaxID=2668052 RepID=UPI0013D65DDE|nr:hypothetical protein [Mangrovibacterium lignilyticum]
MTIPFRPLSEVKMILEDAGTDISYAFDDLIFVEHTAYLIQFDDENKSNLKIYFNTEIGDAQAEAEKKKLLPYVEKRKMSLTPCGKFTLKQKEDSEEIDILFFPS